MTNSATDGTCGLIESIADSRSDLERKFNRCFFLFDQTKEETFTEDKSVNKEQKVDSKYRLTEKDYSLSLKIL